MSHDQITPGRSGRLRRASRLSGAALVAGLLAAGGGAAAFAYWQATSSTQGGMAAADSLQQGATPSASAAQQSVTVSWAAGTTAGGHAASGYTVRRYNASTGGTPVAATGGCAGVLATLSCTETGVPNGTWYYTVTPMLGNWSGAESARSGGALSDGTPPSVSVTSISPAPNGAGYDNTSPVVVTLTAVDNPGGSGVASVRYALDGGQPVTVAGSAASVSVAGDGTHTLVYSTADQAGNVSAAQTLTVKIDTQAPAAPTLAVPAVVNAANAAALPVSGTAESGSTVTVTASDGAGHLATGTATASTTGAWSLPTLNVTALYDGAVTVSATAQDAAGNTSSATAVSLAKDTAPPTAPTMSAPATVSAATAASVTVSGTAEPGASVALKITDAGASHTVTAAATADGTGHWTMPGLNLTALADGQLTYAATATDAAGNTGATATQTGTKDTVSAAPVFTTVPSKITSDSVSSVQLAGTAEAGATVALTATDSANHSATASATANGSGNWSATMNLSALNPGPLTFSAQATDVAGNVSTVTTAASRIGPKVVSVTLQNGGTAGTADTNDKVVVVFDEAMSPSSFCDLWTSPTGPWTQNTNSVSVQITRNAGNDTLALPATGCTTSNFGSLALGASYTTSTGGNLTFKGSGQTQTSSVSLSSDGKTLTITLGGIKSGTPATGVAAGTPSYTPATTGTPTDTGGVTLSTHPVSGTSSRF
ncbi:Ig-like domain-containing protein [Sinomonas sp. JGH33]|uniref:Ig-like domain-containing protein n=1 Tax=Sinomonas terricola TaxID=3110330 RepID=A0ABU5T292_9MICC|nr:Ig-like domain-containing protein [Sinomonas sp. JGH33]MEA5453774.1 Ig-like domain-containing protein [Sinomonas sp. JGH33]